jgi:hypothetical protein
MAVAVTLGSFLITLALATYQPSLNTMAVLLAGGTLLFAARISSNKNAWSDSYGWRKIINFSLAIIISGCIYNSSLLFLEYWGLL